MANTVDERIVEAKFDASDFEKGVNKTIKKLDELKKSLNLEDAGKNITEFAKETSEGVNKAESALQRLSDRFTTFKGMLKQQILSGLAQEFSNAVLSIERSIAGLVKSISSDQVGAGMNKYTEILNSVRTMTAAGIDQTRAYEAVKRLGDYSDQTSYSLSQMTSAMSKLVASGMEIEKAEKSVEGLANMAASAGVNIYDAQRAFVNFSQAYSSGTMRIQDWTSFESLNMGTENVMKVFMQAAEEVGTLTKTVDKNGNEIYKTTNKVNKAVKAGKQVATSGFRDTLSYGWLDKKTMEQATAVLSYFEDLEANINDLTEEELAKFSTKAFQAAKEARSFADVMGTVKDVVATGWATSFEIIFGKLDKATEFFTWLSESRLAEAIYSIGEFRNAVLTAWGTDWAEGGIFRKRDENGNFGTGRDMLVDTLKNIDELIGSIHEGLEDLFPEEFNGYLRRTLSFPEILGKNLGYFTRDIRDASKRLLDFFTIEQEVTEDGETKQKRFLREDIAARIGKIGQGLASVIGVFNKLYKIITETFEKVFFKVQPIIGAIGDAIGTIMEPFTKLNADTGFFKDFTNAIDNFLIVLDPVLKLVPPVIEFLGELGAFFVDNAIAVAAANIEIISGALGLLIEMFGGTSAQKANDGIGVIEGWTNGIKEFGESCREGLTAIKEFFKALFDDIRTLLGIGEQTEGEDGGFFAKISNFFQTNEFIKNVRKWVSQAIKDVQKFVTTTIPKTLSKLPSVVQSFFHSLFYKKKMVWNGQTTEEKEVPTALKEWLDGAVDSVRNFISSIPSRIAQVPSLIGEFIHSLFWQKTYRYNGSMMEETEIPTALGQWLIDAKNAVWTFITETLPGAIKDLPSIIGRFLNGLLWRRQETDEKGMPLKEPIEVPTALGQWLIDASNAVWTFITDTLPGAVKNLPSVIGRFLNGLFWRRQETDEKGMPLKEPVEVPTALNEWLTNASNAVWTFITETLPGAIKDLPSIIGRFLNGLLWRRQETDEKGMPLKEPIEVPTALGQWLIDASNAVWTFVTDTLPGAVKNLPSVIGRFLNGLFWRRQETDEKGMPLKDPIEVPTALNEWLTNASNAVWTFITETLPGAIKDLPSIIGRFLNGLLWRRQETDEKGMPLKEPTEVPTALNKWLEQASKDAVTFIENLPDMIRGIPSIVDSFVSAIVNSTNQNRNLEQAKREITAQFTDEAGNIVDPQGLKLALKDADIRLGKAAEGFNLWESIKKIGGAIKDAFIDLGPDILAGLQGAFEWLGEKLGDATNFLNTAHNEGRTLDEAVAEKMKDENGEDSPLWAAIQSIGQTIFDFITKTIPAFISSAVDEVKMQIPKLLSGLFNSGETESQNAIEGLSRMFGLDSHANSEMNIAQQAADAIQGVTGELQETAKQEEKVYIRTSEALTKVRKELAMLQGYDHDDTGHYFYNLDTYEGDTAYKQKEKELSDMIDYLNSIDQLTEAWVIDNGNGTYSRIEEGVEKKQEQGEGFLGAIQSLLTGFADIVGKIGESDTLKVVAICAAIMYALNAISDTLSIADELEAPGYTAKWTAIGIAVMGIVGILGWLTYLASNTSDEGTARLEQVKETLADVGEFIKSLAEIVKWVTIASAAKQGLETIGDLFGESDDGGTWYGSMLSSWLTRLGELGLVATGADVVGQSFESLFESMSNMLSDIGSGIDEFMTFLSPAIKEMADLSSSLDQAIQAVDKIGQLIGKFYDLIGVVGISVSEADEGTKAVMAAASLADPNANKSAVFLAQQLDQRMAFVFELSTLMNNLADSLKTMESIDDPVKQIGRMMDVIDAVDEDGVNLFAKFIEKLSTTVVENITVPGRTDLFNFSDFSIGLSMLGDALSVFKTSISGLTVENVTSLDKTLDVFNKLAESFSSVGGKKSNFMELFTGDNSLGTFGKEIKQFGTRIQSFFDNVRHIQEIVGTEEKDINSYNSVIEMVIRIANGMAEAATKLSTHTDAGKFTEIGNALPTFGTHLAYFCTNVLSNLALNGNQDIDKLNMVLATVNIIEKIANAVSQMAISNVSGHGGVAKLLGDLMSAFTGEEGSTTVFSSFLDIVKNLMTVDLPALFSGENDLYSVGFTAGSNLDAGLAAGIAQGTAVTAAEQLAEKIKTTVPEIWQEQSPSKLFALYGQYLDEGLANGILAYQNTPIDAASEMATEAVDNTISILNTIKDLAISDMDVTPTITPVVDLTNVDNASEYIDGLYHPGAIGLDLSGVNRNVQSAIPSNYQSTNNDTNFAGMISDLRAQIAMLNGAIGTIPGSLSMNGMQVVLDSGAIVGGIIDKVDSTLGRRGFYAGRE